MKERYRLFLRRKSVYYAFDNTTKTFESLKTKDKPEARVLLKCYTRLHNEESPFIEALLDLQST